MGGGRIKQTHNGEPIADPQRFNTILDFKHCKSLTGNHNYVHPASHPLRYTDRLKLGTLREIPLSSMPDPLSGTSCQCADLPVGPV